MLARRAAMGDIAREASVAGVPGCHQSDAGCIPAVLFHGCRGVAREGKSLLKRPNCSLRNSVSIATDSKVISLTIRKKSPREEICPLIGGAARAWKRCDVGNGSDNGGGGGGGYTLARVKCRTTVVMVAAPITFQNAPRELNPKAKGAPAPFLFCHVPFLF